MTPVLLAVPGMPLLAAAVLAFAGALGPRALAWISGAVAAAALALVLSIAGPVLAGGAVSLSVP